MQIRILTGAQVKQALPMSRAIAAMRRAFGQYSAGRASVPLRNRLSTDKGIVLLMPAYIQESGDLAVKLVSVYSDNPRLGLPTVTASVLVLDSRTGRLRALMDGDALTALRTGAAGGLAADLLARRDVHCAALFGAGPQGRAQLQALLAVRPISRVLLVAHRSDAARRLAAEVETWPQAPAVEVLQEAGEAVRQADVVLAATTSHTPLFDGRLLRPGSHVTGVGSFTPEMQEIDAETVRRARVVVDSRHGCLAEAGDIIKAGATIHAELGEIVNGTADGRQNAGQITFFKSVGLAAQDAVAAAEVLAAAESKNLGRLVEL